MIVRSEGTQTAGLSVNILSDDNAENDVLRESVRPDVPSGLGSPDFTTWNRDHIPWLENFTQYEAADGSGCIQSWTHRYYDYALNLGTWDDSPSDRSGASLARSGAASRHRSDLSRVGCADCSYKRLRNLPRSTSVIAWFRQLTLGLRQDSFSGSCQ